MVVSAVRKAGPPAWHSAGRRKPHPKYDYRDRGAAAPLLVQFCCQRRARAPARWSLAYVRVFPLDGDWMFDPSRACHSCAMFTPWPAARPAFSGKQIIADAIDLASTRFLAFRELDPTDPFVACERREIDPCGHHVRFGQEHGAQIFWEFVDDTGRNDFCHAGLTLKPIHRQSGIFFDQSRYVCRVH